jgi:hypothetical protein
VNSSAQNYVSCSAVRWYQVYLLATFPAPRTVMGCKGEIDDLIASTDQEVVQGGKDRITSAGPVDVWLLIETKRLQFCPRLLALDNAVCLSAISLRSLDTQPRPKTAVSQRLTTC